jgi:hypothetical protein
MESQVPELNHREVDLKKLVLVLAKAGLINDEIAVSIGMTPRQFDYLLEKYPDFREILNEAKEEPNHKVEQALFRRALGYTVKETVAKAGKPVQVTLKEIAPSELACIFWLKNRSPKRWRDVIEHKHSLRDRMDRAHDATDRASRARMIPDGNDDDDSTERDIH